MTTLTLELTDEQAQTLTEGAEQMGLTLPELALLCVLFSEPFAEQRGSMDFESATEYVFQKNSELYARLADHKERVSYAIRRILNENEELYRRRA